MAQTMDRAASFVARLSDWFSRRPGGTRLGLFTRVAVAVLLVLTIVFSAIGWYFSREPHVLWVNNVTTDGRVVVGFATTDTLIRVAETLLDKPGGYLSNDVTPPSIVLDNIPNWEQGVLLQIKDMSNVMRNHYSRSQSQSAEYPSLKKAESEFYFNPNRWILPSAESHYRTGIEFVSAYRDELIDPQNSQAQFFARADNLREWLAIVEKRLGGLSQKLSASVGDRRVNTDLAGDPSAENATPRPGNISEKTPRLKVDDHFYEARGNVWALVAFMRAAEFDFNSVLEKKNALVSLRQIIRELEASLEPLGSPIVLNGDGYGLFANHSLVMASYLSRANAGVINLRELLDQG